MFSRSLSACTAPSAQVCIQSPTGRRFSLTDRERKSIETSWSKIADKDLLGQDIFRHIFTAKPALKKLWGLDGESLDDLAENSLFQKHANNFTTFLDLAVRSLSLDGVYVITLAAMVGKRHVLFKDVTFDAEYWLLFKNAVLEALNRRIASPDTRKRWQLFVMFIVTEVKDAFNKEIRAKRSSSHSLPAMVSSTSPDEAPVKGIIIKLRNAN